MNATRSRSRIVALDVGLYLKKLKVERESPSLAYLCRLHKQHIYTFPVENLDFILGKAIPLDILSIQKKLLSARRGGVAFELNGVFHQLLLNLGFNCHLISAQLPEADSWSPDFEHMAILVKMNGMTYLCDVSSPGLFLEPRLIVQNQPQVDHTQYFKFDRDPDGNWILLKTPDLSVYKRIFRFSDSPREFIEFIPRWLRFQEDLDSRLKQSKYVSALFKNGRATLTDTQLILDYKGTREEYPVRNEDEFLAKLKYHFGIEGEKITRFN